MMAAMSWAWDILLRWLHVVSACLLVGAAFFYAMTSRGASGPPDDGLDAHATRVLKMLARAAILVLLATGIYNMLLNRAAYHQNLPLTHALLGSHALLALIILAALEIGLSTRRSKQARAAWMAIALVLMLLTVAVASSLKYAREHPRQDSRELRSI